MLLASPVPFLHTPHTAPHELDDPPATLALPDAFFARGSLWSSASQVGKTWSKLLFRRTQTLQLEDHFPAKIRVVRYLLVLMISWSSSPRVGTSQRENHPHILISLLHVGLLKRIHGNPCYFVFSRALTWTPPSAHTNKNITFSKGL